MKDSVMFFSPEITFAFNILQMDFCCRRPPLGLQQWQQDNTLHTKNNYLRCYFLDVEDSHILHGYHHHSEFSFIQNYLRINPIISQVFYSSFRVQQDIFSKSLSVRIKITTYLQTERKKSRTKKVTAKYELFSRCEISRRNITYILGFIFDIQQISCSK